ncbi:MAG: rhodanese domain-containing protein [Rickettsiaceae bacterium]|nr:rhodanese domain-containing protein [Rickettsiaceae bacterium]
MTKYHDTIAVLSFYSFVNISTPEILMSKILANAMRKSIKGTILIATEGINGSISGKFQHLEYLLSFLKSIVPGADIIHKFNYTPQHPFSKLKVKLKKEIVTMGLEELDVKGLKGEYIEPKDWDEAILDKNAIVIDTRNNYEVAVGSFEGAINPQTDTFRDFPRWSEDNLELLQNKKILMFCTGGIRCEKSTAYLKLRGIKNVYHLKGGILQYLEDTGNKNKLWHGECFVFDERVSVDEELAPQFLR